MTITKELIIESQEDMDNSGELFGYKFDKPFYFIRSVNEAGIEQYGVHDFIENEPIEVCIAWWKSMLGKPYDFEKDYDKSYEQFKINYENNRNNGRRA